MSTDIELSKTQIPQKLFWFLVSKCRHKSTKIVAIPLDRDNLPELVSN